MGSAMEQRLDQAGIAGGILSHADPRLRALVRRRPGRVVFDIVRSYALIVAAFALLAFVQAPWVPLLAFLVIGSQQYALFILGHDGMHTNLIPNRRWNDRLATALLLAPLGTRVKSARVAHLTHHRYLGSAMDPDRHVHVASNKQTRSAFLLFLSGFATVGKALVRILPFGKSGAAPATGPVPGAGSLGARLPVFVAQAIVFLAIWSVLPFWAYFVYWMLPVYAMVFVADEIRAFCEHAQPVLPDEAADPRRLTTFEPNALERILFAPHNMCYHAEHHLWPFVPYYNLPKLHALIGEQRGIEVRRSYVGFLFRYFSALPSLGAAARPSAG
jgi:fatty acid desaturase